AARGRSRVVRGRPRGTARPARRGALPRAAPGGRHRSAREALDARAGHRLRHRPERGRALRGVSRSGVLVQARPAQDSRAARACARRARRALYAEGVSPRGARHRHRAARAPRARDRRLYCEDQMISMNSRIAALLMAAAVALPAAAQDYPAKPIVIVVPAAAGGPTDTLTRVLAAAMGNAMKQQFVIENAGGAGGLIGMSTAPALYRKLPYDTLADFDYIGQVADVPMTLVARKTLSPSSFGDFLAYIK